MAVPKPNVALPVHVIGALKPNTAEAVAGAVKPNPVEAVAGAVVVTVIVAGHAGEAVVACTFPTC